MRSIRASYSIYAYVKSICLAQNRRYTTSLQEKFTEAFDVYLSLHMSLLKCVNEVLGRGDDSWHMKNFCPACTYTQANEGDIVYSFGYVLDGVNAQKCWADSGHANSFRSYSHDSDIRMQPSKVDEFKHVVTRRKKVTKKKKKGRAAANEGEVHCYYQVHWTHEDSQITHPPMMMMKMRLTHHLSWEKPQ